MVGLVLAMAAGVQACSDDEPAPAPETVDRTLLMFMPWTGDLTDYLEGNVRDMEAVVAREGLASERVLVYFATSATEASLFEIVYNGKGSTRRSTLAAYNGSLDVTTPAGVASLLADVKRLSPSRSYALTVGCHGYGWLRKSTFAGLRKQSLRGLTTAVEAGPDAGLSTRFFGGTQMAWQTDITDFAHGIESAGMHFDYIVFDDCYMASMEAVYDLRHLTDYVVASPCEMMAAGLPYARIGQYLLGTPDLKALCAGFYDFYSSYSRPYGTLSLVDCRELDNMAALMKRINAAHTIDASEVTQIQRLDYFNPAVFVDFGDYVERLLNGDSELLEEFRGQLAKTVVYEVHTPYFYTNAAGRIRLDRCSGISVSDPSSHRLAADKMTTAWWVATH